MTIRWSCALSFAMALGGLGCGLNEGERTRPPDRSYVSRPPFLVVQAQHWDVSPPLRELPARLASAEPRERPDPDMDESRFRHDDSFVDPLTQTFFGPFAIPMPSAGFDGLGVGFSGPAGTFQVQYIPPDPNGDVGPNHYIQTVNSSFAIMSKTGTVLYGPAEINSLWMGFGGDCETYNDGDPVVKYDRLADRWVISQFAVEGPPDYQCVAVSTTNDPTGSYRRYSFQFSMFNDYPKMAVWPDAYYFTQNLFSSGGSDTGSVCAFDRNSMLNGTMATSQCFNTNGYDSLLPSDLVGTMTPPAGSPNYVVALDTNALALWSLHIDWSTPSNSSLNGPTSLPVTAFSTPTSIAQPSTTSRLSSLADRLMYRLNYRRFADHESLVVNHTVTTSSHAAVRWYELRSPGGTPTVFQEGTYSPDSNSRWMGSINMDHAGNIGLGFSIASSANSVYPGIHYSGRLASDPPGMMTQGEGSFVEGSGAQTSGGRWGDYSSMSVDPTDDCTFWYTNQYIASSGTRNWHTRISSFRFPTCLGSGGAGGGGGGGAGGTGGGGGGGAGGSGGVGGGGGGGAGGSGGSGGGGGGGDTVPPQVMITQPVDNATVPLSFTIKVDTTDNSGTVSKVELSADGALLTIMTAPPWSFDVPSGRLQEGMHMLAAKAYDPSNNSASSTAVHITVKNQPGGTGGAGAGGGGTGGSPGGGANSGGCAAAGSGAGGAPGASLVGLLVLLRRRRGRCARRYGGKL